MTTQPNNPFVSKDPVIEPPPKIKITKPFSFPAILIFGPSGTGKSSSIRTLDPNQTKILNLETKTLPFRNASAFLEWTPVEENAKALVDFFNELKNAIESPAIKYIVIDSFYKYIEISNIIAKQIKTGWDIWNYVNDNIDRLMATIKRTKDKFVIVTALDEIVHIEQASGNKISRIRTATMGKKWEGKIEKEFTIVLQSMIKTTGDKRDYKLQTAGDEYSPAKAPFEMFNPIINNDLKMICDRVEEYYKN